MKTQEYFDRFKTWVEANQLFGSIKDMSIVLGVDEQFIVESEESTESFEEFCNLLDSCSDQVSEEELLMAENKMEEMWYKYEYDKLVACA